jgi:hypothetical protein
MKHIKRIKEFQENDFISYNFMSGTKMIESNSDIQKNLMSELEKELGLNFDDYKKMAEINSFSYEYNIKKFKGEILKEKPDLDFVENVILLGYLKPDSEVIWYHKGFGDECYTNLLSYAAYINSVECTKYLLDRGANPLKRDYAWKVALHYAADSNSVDVASILIERFPESMEITSYAGWTPLHSACCYGSEMIVRFLIQEGANKEAETDDLWSPLYIATNNKQYNCVKLLLEYGVDPDTRGSNLWTPLHISCMDNHPISLRIAEKLIKNNANIDAIDFNEMTPLHLAVHHKNKDKIRLLLRNNANKNIKNIKNRYAWDLADDSIKADIPELKPNK